MTTAERDVAMKEANEKMKAYYVKRPAPPKKRRHGQRDSEHRLQLALGASFLVAFVATPFLGRKIAQDSDFRAKWIPSWYDFTVKKPAQAWSRQELHEQMVEVQRELHERAIRGDFTKEKLEEMRRHLHGVDPEDDEHGWGKIHPGVDDDEDIEEDDE
jgi:hypothetical protein